MSVINELLPKALEKLPPDTLVHLGSKSAFFDVATASEMLSSGYLDNLSHKLKERFKNLQGKAEFALYNALSCPPKWRGDIAGHTCDTDIDDYISSVRAWVGKIDTLRASLKAAESNFQTFLPLNERIVKDYYPRIQKGKDGGVVVIVPGAEIGRWWSLSEKENCTATDDIEEV